MLIQVEIPYETVEACILSAVGYCRYWANVNHAVARSHAPLSVREAYARGNSTEKPGEWHALTRRKIAKAIPLLARASPRQFAALFTGHADMITGDCLIQLVVLGEIRYG